MFELDRAINNGMTYQKQKSAKVIAEGQSYPSHMMTFWTGETVSSSDGSWTLDIQSLKLKKVFTVTAIARSSGGAVSDIPLVGVRQFDTSIIRGYVVQNNSGGILIGGSFAGIKFRTAPTTIDVFIVGM
jgi:hypothetical protein